MPLFPVVRAGMHTGQAIAGGGDWFGATLRVMFPGSASSRELLRVGPRVSPLGSGERRAALRRACTVEPARRAPKVPHDQSLTGRHRAVAVDQGGAGASRRFTVG
jgi:hypothetical protein